MQLKRQRGMLLCEDCRDNLKKIITPKPRWSSPRDNSLTTVPVNNPTVYTISAATGINALRQSRDYDHEGGRRNFHMYVVSDGGAITVVADPPIVAGLQGDILSLTGTSDTDTVQINDADTVALINGYPAVLGSGDTITFVYNTTLTSGGWGVSLWGSTGYGFGGQDYAWVETSRTKGGF